MLSSEFILTFTKDFLTEYCGTSDYFNVEYVAKVATDKINGRYSILSKYISINPSLVKSILENGPVCFEEQNETPEFDENDFNNITNVLESFFVVDLFDVFSSPIYYANETNKGYPRHVDLFKSTYETEINAVFNIKLLGHAYDEYHESLSVVLK